MGDWRLEYLDFFHIVARNVGSFLNKHLDKIIFIEVCALKGRTPQLLFN